MATLTKKDLLEAIEDTIIWFKRLFCQCENKTELDVDTRNLNTGHTKSCGCLQKENREKYNNLRHIHKTYSLKKKGILI